MARIRNIKPEFFRHEELQDLELKNPGKYPMFVYEALWSQCDRQGVFLWKPKILKLDILPFLPFDMEDTLKILSDAGYIIKYTAEGKDYGIIPTFEKHQSISRAERENRNIYPLPANNTETVSQPYSNHTETVSQPYSNHTETVSQPYSNHTETVSQPYQNTGNLNSEFGNLNSEFGNLNSEFGNLNSDPERENSLSPAEAESKHDLTLRIQGRREAWNRHGGNPKCHNLVFPPSDILAMEPTFRSYPDAEIDSAIKNYLHMIRAPDFDVRELPGGRLCSNFKNFVIRWVDKFTDEAKPLERFMRGMPQAGIDPREVFDDSS
jgi:hypothetical protein